MPDENTARFDLGPLIREAVEKLQIEIEAGAEERVVEILEERGWTCTAPGFTDENRHLRDELKRRSDLTRDLQRALWWALGDEGISLTRAQLEADVAEHMIEVTLEETPDGPRATFRRHHRGVDLTKRNTDQSKPWGTSGVKGPCTAPCTPGRLHRPDCHNSTPDTPGARRGQTEKD